MTPDVFRNAMQILADQYEVERNKETTHEMMDDLLCEVLKDLGYEEGIDIFTKHPKFYI